MVRTIVGQECDGTNQFRITEASELLSQVSVEWLPANRTERPDERPASRSRHLFTRRIAFSGQATTHSPHAWQASAFGV